MTSSYDLDLVKRLERVEIESSISMFEGSSGELGVEVHRSGDTLIRIDHSEAGRLNRVSGLGIFQPATEAELDAIVELYGRSGVRGFWVSVSPITRPSDVGSWLLARGFEPEGNSTKVCRRAGDPAAMQTDLRVKEVGVANRADLAAALEAGFGMTPGRGALIAAAAGKPGWRWFLAYDGDEPAAAGGLYVQDGVGWLGYGATVPSKRRRGGQGAIIAARVAAAAEMGCEWVTSETAEDRPEAPVPSYHNMLRNGFELVYLKPSYRLILR